MSRRTAFLIGIAAFLATALVVTMTPVPARATTYDKLTHMTFTGSVQIPGATLGAGTYRFRLVNPSTGRNVLQVLSHDGAIVYAMFHTIPDSRTEVTDESVVTFRETPAGVPPAVKSLFYGGERRGYEFVYPSGGVLPMERPQPPVTYWASPVPALPRATEAEVPPIAPGYVASPVVEFTHEAPALPNTASPLPWIAAVGMVSLIVGVGVGLFRRRLN